MTSSATEIALTRVFDAPRELVWKAWTDPEHVQAWWGPRGFTTRVEALDLRNGGRWRYVMAGPEGKELPLHGAFREVVTHERIVTSHELGEGFEDAAAAELPRGIVVTCLFEDLGGRTRLALRIAHASAADRKKHEAKGGVAGWQSTLDCLDEHLAGLAGELVTEREIIVTRVLDAPRELVWKVWTAPEHLAAWWGPRGFTTTTERMEVRPGGTWRFTMHGPDGRDYPNRIDYLEVAAPERLVYQHAGEKGHEPVHFRVVANFISTGTGGAKTRVVLRSVFPSSHARDFVIREYHAVEGGRQTLTRLAEHLASQSSDAAGGRPFVITRMLQAPRATVWRAWTERERLQKWFGPKGFTMPSCSLDLRPGGHFRYELRAPDGSVVRARWVFRAVVPEERLVFVSSFTDAHGEIARHPGHQAWPLELLSTVSFADHAGIGRGTVVTVEWVPLHASASECATFNAGHDSMQQGWSGTFERLAEYLQSK